MDVSSEVASIVLMIVVLFAGLWLLGWAYGDFERPRTAPPPKDQPTPPPQP